MSVEGKPDTTAPARPAASASEGRRRMAAGYEASGAPWTSRIILRA